MEKCMVEIVPFPSHRRHALVSAVADEAAQTPLHCIEKLIAQRCRRYGAWLRPMGVPDEVIAAEAAAFEARVREVLVHIYQAQADYIAGGRK
jgi:hypothetical protein